MKEACDKTNAYLSISWSIESFDCMQHDILIAKVYVLGFDKKYVRVIYTYLSNRIQVKKSCLFFE